MTKIKKYRIPSFDKIRHYSWWSGANLKRILTQSFFTKTLFSAFRAFYVAVHTVLRLHKYGFTIWATSIIQF